MINYLYRGELKMRDKKNKIKFIVNIGNRDFSFVVSDSYYKSINGGESATALQNLKDANEIKYADCGNKEKAFFNYISKSFEKETQDIAEKIGVVDTPVKMIQLVTQKCRLFKEYCDRFLEQGLILASINFMPEELGREEVARNFLLCVMNMYANCQTTVTKNIINDVRDQAAGLNIAATQMLAASLMLTIGSAEKRTIDFLLSENKFISAEVVDKAMNKSTTSTKIDYKPIKKVAEAEINDEIVNKKAVFEFDSIKNLEVMSPEQENLLKNVAERAFITDGMEVGYNNSNEIVSQELLIKGAYLTPANSILALEDRIGEIGIPTRCI